MVFESVLDVCVFMLQGKLGFSAIISPFFARGLDFQIVTLQPPKEAILF